MKRLKFLVNTTDKYTGTKYEENKEYDFEDERADELLQAKRKNGDKKGEPLVALVEEESKEEKETTNNEEVETVSNEAEETDKEETKTEAVEASEEESKEEKKNNKNKTTKNK